MKIPKKLSPEEREELHRKGKLWIKLHHRADICENEKCKVEKACEKYNFSGFDIAQSGYIITGEKCEKCGLPHSSYCFLWMVEDENE